MELNDYLSMKALENGNGHGLSPYEQVKLDYMSNRNHTSGIGVAGLVLGTVGTAAAIGAWIFAPLYGNARANQAKEVAIAAKEISALQTGATQRQLDQLTNLLSAERSERLQGDYTISQTITDTVSGSQQGQLTAMQQAELAASQVATQQVMTGLMTGRYSENPQRVALYRDATPCPCPAGGCGCNG